MYIPPMPDYAADFTKAVDELAEMEAQREALERAIARHKRKVAALAELCDESDDSKPLDLKLGGLTEACRTAMRGVKKEWMTIAEIQEALKDLGFPLQNYKAPTASITTTVNRLVEAEEVAISRRPRGASEYKYIGPIVSANALRTVAESAAHLGKLLTTSRRSK